MTLTSKILRDRKKVYYLDHDPSFPLSVMEFGWEKTKPNHTWSPNGRARYLIHLVKDGCGTVEREDGTKAALARGDCFITRPEEGSIVKSDAKAPFEYYWIAFNGKKAKYIIELTTKNLYTKYKESGIFAIDELLKCSISDSIGTLSALFTVLNSIKDNIDNEDNDFVKKAILYIESNYYKHFSVEEYSKSIGVSRSHFTTTFTKRAGISPYDLLIKVRIDNAIKLIEATHLSVSQVAYKVGFTSLDRFGKMFKLRTGMSPREYKSSKLNIT